MDTPATPATPATQAPSPSGRPLRVVTAASLFDGHDAAINIMRRVMQAEGAEVIHLGHDRSVDEVADAAIQEDADAIAVSSYQGGHNEYFRYLVERLAARGRGDIPVFGGGGGTITDREIAALHAAGVARIYSVEDGRRLGLVGMIRDMLSRARAAVRPRDASAVSRALAGGDDAPLGLALSVLEAHATEAADGPARDELRALIAASSARAPVLGITGTGGAGKSSLTDELLVRLLQSNPEARIAVLSVDPSRRRTGGALLGDRIRMNSTSNPRVFMRSMATRQANASVSAAVVDAVALLRASGFALVILETAGIGQSGAEVVDVADVSLYVMTPEFGAPSQLEKIAMLDYADVVAINKSDKRGAEDARRYVAKQLQRNRGDFERPPEEMPVFCCTASRFADAGVDRVCRELVQRLAEHGATLDAPAGHRDEPDDAAAASLMGERTRYLADVATAVRRYKTDTERAAEQAATADGLARALAALGHQRPAVGEAPNSRPDDPLARELSDAYGRALAAVPNDALELLRTADTARARVSGDVASYEVRGKVIEVEATRTSLSGTRVPKVCAPATRDWGDVVRWRRLENLPGEFPYTAGVFPFKRDGEDPTRMFAGEGTPEQTNRRFHYLASGQSAVRLSTAFDSVTLYGRDPGRRPDVYGKVGNSGVSVATLDDAKRLYSGFDLCAPSTSVSMTINGPAPMILAMFLATAIDQAAERRLRATGRWDSAVAALDAKRPGRPTYREPLPPGHDGTGLGLLGASAADVLDAAELAEVTAATLRSVRGTVQADILKEDQAQNTCIFSTDFALSMQGDIQQFFVDHDVRNFYSVSISGYHIAEAGANPITQLAFTLANGFTFVEYFRARGMDVDAFARNLSFFFSNGLDPEYAVIGRVARRIWAIAMRDVYQADARSQQLKYHIQTSGRSLHAQEIDFNDIRTTLQAFYAIADNCNSLHTNAYDEAITTPTEASVRRALAIQLILNHELGLLDNENPLQGAYVVEWLTHAVEEAVLDEFERISERGGVLGAMELMYQRSRIQDESLEYESRKHSGQLPIIGVNRFVDPNPRDGVVEVELVRADDAAKDRQISGVAEFQARNDSEAGHALRRLQDVARAGGNVFAELMHTVRHCSLGQISEALFAVGGQYRRNT